VAVDGALQSALVTASGQLTQLPFLGRGSTVFGASDLLGGANFTFESSGTAKDGSSEIFTQR